MEKKTKTFTEYEKTDLKNYESTLDTMINEFYSAGFNVELLQQGLEKLQEQLAKIGIDIFEQ